MKILNHALAGAAAAALVVSQAAAAAPVADIRTAAVSEDSEALGGTGAGALPAIAVISVFIITGLVILLTDDDDDDAFPVSP